MTKEEVFNKIADLVAEQFGIDRTTIKSDLNFQNDLDADSIDFVEFVLSLESAFGTDISDEDAENIKTIDEAVDYVMSNADNK
ncbi:acyl carrier protein [Apilactobacillus apinorum]|uniref:acyl carrier protein n=1 Tax=Apilactobacillus apinorum TaxID=1218495 RepID=UPI0006B613B6|nr:acyl carrier protein [Apilactobacillus apinorum]KOY68832.1 Acyl carrier protein [Apilactobacillus apinorum]CAI2667261.1 acpP Acyl carrier protein [Apilactobacillus apinorum]